MLKVDNINVFYGAIHAINGISIDVSRMNRVRGVDAEDMTVTVQAGRLRKQRNEAS